MRKTKYIQKINNLTKGHRNKKNNKIKKNMETWKHKK
jgi:hypothetical protein